MQAQGLKKLIDIAATVASAIEPEQGRRVSATHAALLASRLFEAIKAERAALEPADLRTRALLDRALDHCEKMRLQAASALLADGMVNPHRASRLHRAPRPAPHPRLRLFQVIDGGHAAPDGAA